MVSVRTDRRTDHAPVTSVPIVGIDDVSRDVHGTTNKPRLIETSLTEGGHSFKFC